MPAERKFSENVKRRQTCKSTLSFLKGNLFFRQYTFLPRLVHVAFWTIKHESSVFSLFLASTIIKIVFLYGFFQPVVYNSCCFPENSVGSLHYHVQYHDISVLVLQKCCALLPVSSSLAPDFPRLLPFSGIFSKGKWGDKFSAGTSPRINRYAALFLMD